MQVHTIRWATLVSLLCGMAAPAVAQESSTAQEKGFEITAEAVAELQPIVFAAVEKVTGAKLPPKLTCRVVRSSRIRQALEREMVEQFRAQFEDERVADTQRKTTARTLASRLVAKYATRDVEILVCPENFENTARVMKDESFVCMEVVRAVLVHEAIHALDDVRYKWSEKGRALRDADAITVYDAIIEGHAQFAARRVCEEMGWQEGFVNFSRAIGFSGESSNEAERMVARVLSVNASFAYRDGERFIAALHAKGGEGAIARAFSDPPEDTEVILNPEWFFSPELRPKASFDLDAGLDVLAALWPTEAWRATRQSLTKLQLGAVLDLLPDENVKRVLTNLRVTRVLALHSLKKPGTMVTGVLFEMRQEKEAAFLLSCENDLMRRKDEKMKEGRIRISKAEYEAVEKDGHRGTFVSKEVRIGPRSIDVCTLILTSSRLVLEVTWSNEPITKADGLKCGAAMLEKARALNAGKKGETPRKATRKKANQRAGQKKGA